MSFKCSFLIFIIPVLLIGCGKKDAAPVAATTTVATPFATAIDSISTSVAAAGSGLGTSAFAPSESQMLVALESQYPFLTVTPLTSALCDVHGMPVESGTTTYISQSDVRYPFIHTYCAMTISDGDTVRGSFDMVKELMCALEKGGVTFNGTEQSIAIDFTDTACWPDGGPDGATSGTLTATGTAPASFNTHFEKGVSFIYTEGSNVLTYKVAANITSSSIEFIANESWSNGNIGVMAGSLNKTTGALLFEKRDERIRSTCGATEGSCGWNRHTRLAATLTMSAAGEPTGLTNLSYGYADTQVKAAAMGNPADTNSSGKIITSSGTLSGGIKSRVFAASGKTTAQLKDFSQWTESVHTGCMTGAAGINDGADCTSNTGIANFTADTKFALYSTSAQLSPSAWLAAFSGFNFTAVDIDDDQAF
jgi:hypothetical protein